jgi:hypothetical protein
MRRRRSGCWERLETAVHAGPARVLKDRAKKESNGLWTWAKRRQSDGRAVTQVKRLSLVRLLGSGER